MVKGMDMNKIKPVLLFLIITVVLISGCGQVTEQIQDPRKKTTTKKTEQLPPSPVEQISAEERNKYDHVVIGARGEVQRQVMYDATYRQIDYPNGDVPPEVGACTDVVVRAYRNAGIDLQQLVHEDMQANFQQYPQNWGLNGTDSNIDHRRVPNLVKFFQRHGQTITTSTDEEQLTKWQWGDVVFWRFSNGLDHCGIVSDRTSDDGLPLVIHNAGMAREEDCLNRWEITGHYRYP